MTSTPESSAPEEQPLETGVQDTEREERLDSLARQEQLSQLDSEAGESRVADFLPFLDWMGGYGPRKGTADALAGSLVALLLLPQAMAYAQLGELPPSVGFYAALVAGLGYALLGSTRFLSIGPVALVSLLVAESVTLATAAGYAATDAALVLAAISGLALIAGALLGISLLADFLGKPVLDGFAGAAALLIASSQLRPFLGIEGERASGFLGRMGTLVQGLGDAHVPTLILGVSCFALLGLGSWGLPKLSERLGLSEQYAELVGRATPLLMLGAACGATIWMGLEERGVAVVGALDLGVPPFGLPPLELELWKLMLPGSLTIALVAFVVALALAQSLAGRDDRVDPRQEMLGLGMAGIFASFSGGYPVGASVSRSSVLKASRAATPLAAAAAGLLVLIPAFLAAPLVARLPQAALAALILFAAVGMIDLRGIRRTWKIDPWDGAALLITFVAVLVLGVDGGLWVGIVAGLILHMWQRSRPEVVIEGWDEENERFADASRKEIDAVIEPVLLLRIDGDLNFSNARHVRSCLIQELHENPCAGCLVLDMTSCDDVDTSALNMLEDLVHDLAASDVVVALGRPRPAVVDKMRRSGFFDTLGEDQWFDSVLEALQTMKSRCVAPEVCEG